MTNQTRMDKYIFRTSAIVVIILALAAAILSYSALKQLAVNSGIDPVLSYLFPLVLDGLILSGTLLILYFAVRGKRSVFGIFLTLLGVIASIAGNVAVSDNNIVHQMVHGAPALVLFLSLEALTILLRTRSKSESEFTVEESIENISNANNNNENEVEINNASSETDKPVYIPQSNKNSYEDKDDLIQDSTSLPEIEKDNPIQEIPINEYDWTDEEKDSVEPLEITPDIVDEITPNQQKSNKEKDLSFYTPELIPGETKKEKIEWLVQKFPDAKPIDIVNVIGGDGSYIRKTIRDFKNSSSFFN